MMLDTPRPIAAPIESSGNAVTDVGKYHDPRGTGAWWTGTPPRVTMHQSDAEAATDDAPTRRPRPRH